MLARLSAQPSSSARPVRPMRCDVHLGVGRHVDVDHRFELRDVEPARGDVGGHQHRAAAVGELHQHLVALALLQVAVQRQRAEALRLQHVDQVAALLLGVAERQRADRAVVVAAAGRRHAGARRRVDFVEALADLARRRAGARTLDLLRLAQELLRSACAMPSG